MAFQTRQIEKGIGAALALLLDFTGLGDPLGGAGAAVAGHWRRIERGRLAGDRQVQIDAVEQRAGEFVAVALDHIGRAGTAAAGLAEITAGTGIHRCDQLEARRKSYAVAGSRNHNVPGFQGLAQDLQNLAIELRKLVQKQYTVMGQGNFPGLGLRAAVTWRNRCSYDPLQHAFYRMILR